VKCRFCGTELTHLLVFDTPDPNFIAIPYTGEGKKEIIFYSISGKSLEIEYYACPHCFKVLAYSEKEALKLLFGDKS